MVIIIIVAACSVIIVASIVAFVMAKRTRSKPAVPVDAVPLEVVNSLLTATTSPEARSIRHVTPSPSKKEYIHDWSYVSRTYVSCQSEASTLYDLIPPSLPGDDVKMRVWLNGVKNRQGDGEIQFANEHSAWSDDYDDDDNDAALRTSHRDMFAQHAITNVNRKLPPIPVDQRSPPGVDEAPRFTSPVNPQSSLANADLDLHLFQSTPPSPELTSLPIAPRLPVGEHSLPEEDGYIDMASAPSLDDQCGQISGSALSQSEDGYMIPVHPSITGSTKGKKQDSRERSTAGGQHLYLASDTDYLSPVCQQKTIAGRRVGEKGRPNCRPRDPTYLTPV
ncbi:uncharacterized protein [Littorina saxatilis]|uniref:uncharacterized protein n=1 Tax=Littorina saxatilis TaxID=31220 RepID=UPI0038B618B0